MLVSEHKKPNIINLIKIKVTLILHYSSHSYIDERQKRSPNKYDKHYSKFIAQHFGDLGGKYIDDKDEYKSASAENAEDEEGGSHEEAVEEENDEEGDTKANVQEHDGSAEEVDDDHDFVYRNRNDYERIKALSEKQVEELHKKPGNCKNFEKDGMVCAVCKDPETGDTSEVSEIN